MNRIFRRFVLLPAVAGLSFFSSATAQSSIYNPEVAWKKEVMREVTIRQSRHHRKDSSLAKILINAVLSEHIPVYSNVDQPFSSTLTSGDVKSLLEIKSDTIDHLTPRGGTIRKVETSTFNFDSVYQYRLIEEWTFSPISCSATVRIKGIAPLRNYYNRDEYMGRQAIFWVSYKDISPILKRDRRRHAGNSLIRAIWKDYISGATAKTDDPLNIRAIRSIVMEGSPDTIPHHLVPASTDTTIWQRIGLLVEQDLITAYDSTGRVLKPQEYLPPSDTQLVIDPTTDVEYQRIIRHNPLKGDIHAVAIRENWTFDAVTGEVRIVPESVAPPYWSYSYDGRFRKPYYFCWFKFSNFKAVLAYYEQTHPTDNFAATIWNSYFYSDVKPDIVR